MRTFDFMNQIDTAGISNSAPQVERQRTREAGTPAPHWNPDLEAPSRSRVALQTDAGIRNGKLNPVASVRHLAHPQRNLAFFRELAGTVAPLKE
jgi:hypothetical protein